MLYSSHAASDTRVEGSYVATSLNGRSLPAELRVPVTAGDFRLFRLEQGVLRLQPTGRFTLYFRYYHQLVRRGDRPTVTPVMSESETGRYAISGNRIVLTPEKKGGAKSRDPVTATIAGEEMRAIYTLQNGTSRQRIALVLHRDATYW